MIRRLLAFCWMAVFASGPAISAECELHVWPSAATDSSSGSWLSNIGVAGALADYERNKDANLRDQVALIEGLSRPQQAQLLAALDLPALLGMPGARLFFESSPLQPRSAARARARSSASSAACYAELMLTLNRYDKSALHGRVLTSHLTFKDYRHQKLRIKSARVGHPVPHFPPAPGENAELARAELSDAFTANVRAFAVKVTMAGRRQSSPGNPGEEEPRAGPGAQSQEAGD